MILLSAFFACRLCRGGDRIFLPSVIFRLEKDHECAKKHNLTDVGIITDTATFSRLPQPSIRAARRPTTYKL